MLAYARRHLALAESYVHDLPPGPILDFCRVPLALAYASMDSFMTGEGHLARNALYELVDQATRSPRPLR
jgi:farnesyl-diphosphate farnesyltransferase